MSQRDVSKKTNALATQTNCRTQLRNSSGNRTESTAATIQQRDYQQCRSASEYNWNNLVVCGPSRCTAYTHIDKYINQTHNDAQHWSTKPPMVCTWMATWNVRYVQTMPGQPPANSFRRRTYATNRSVHLHTVCA